MQKTAVVSDSTCDIPDEILADLRIHLAPVHVILDGKEYRDRLDIDTRTVYEALVSGRQVTTSGANGNDWAEAYERALSVGERIVALSISPLLSTTYRSAELAVQAGDYPVELINSQTILVPQGFAAMIAARAARKGAEPGEVAAIARRVLAHSRMVAVADTVEFMRKGGRLSALEEKVGSLDGYRPVLRLFERGWLAIDKDETREGTVEKMLATTEADLKELGCDETTPILLAVDHAVAEDEAEELKARLLRKYRVKESFTWDLSPTVGVHLGPGVLGVGYCPAAVADV